MKSFIRFALCLSCLATACGGKTANEALDGSAATSVGGNSDAIPCHDASETILCATDQGVYGLLHCDVSTHQFGTCIVADSTTSTGGASARPENTVGSSAASTTGGSSAIATTANVVTGGSSSVAGTGGSAWVDAGHVDADAGNGSDQDAGLPCTPGQKKYGCYSGSPSTLNVGICRSGVQDCQSDQYGIYWGSCYGEVTPYPWGDNCDGQDNDCDGVVDEDCGRWTFCNQVASDSPDTFGYWGCCSAGMKSSSVWADAGQGTKYLLSLVKGSGVAVYEVLMNAQGVIKRHLFPTTQEFLSWVGERDAWGDPPKKDAFPCGAVTEIPDEALAQIPLGEDIRLRPGVHIVHLASSPDVWYLIEKPNILHPVTHDAATGLYGDSVQSRLLAIPDFLISHYVMGPPIDSANQYDVQSQWLYSINEMMDALDP